MNKQDRQRIISLCQEHLDQTSGTGGCLHIYLADGNYEEDHVRWCVDYAKRQPPEDEATYNEPAMAVSIGMQLLSLTNAERREIYDALWN